MVKVTLQCGTGTLKRGWSIYHALEGTDILSTKDYHRKENHDGNVSTPSYYAYTIIT
jgi:hypothetical protein